MNNENKKLKAENKKLKAKTNNNSAWDFHWNGIGSYEESRRGFYGDFS